MERLFNLLSSRFFYGQALVGIAFRAYLKYKFCAALLSKKNGHIIFGMIWPMKILYYSLADVIPVFFTQTTGGRCAGIKFIIIGGYRSFRFSYPVS
jgi:hypothetical protein